MRFLLDTHTLLWFLTDDAALSTTAKTIVELADNTILISPASYWEIAIKISLGEYRLPEPLSSFMARELSRNGMTILPISIEHAEHVAALPFHHRDPFDRLLIAQALVENVQVVSIDTAFDAYDIKRCLVDRQDKAQRR
ncbi:MAG: PIN domain nuclease [Methylomonas sp.]|nr:MAG: PIN domain nuclease [Methylomonas sp.]PPD24952.1 MAG: PIN domain nuclease [Methylomonas sp.]PPD34137.1 MAG: PIN domain nuclease [Methylomonas sp.]PPD41414.1 MAG: PIN domain nuclease [Methylomonas sp.]PPD52337.1 MAG: PIN domain nuclease [Methylomonas sp.]